MGAASNTVSSLMKVADYLLNFATFLENRLFGEIKDGHMDLDLFDAGGEERLNPDGACMKCWKNFGRRGMAILRTSEVNNYMTFVRCR